MGNYPNTKREFKGKVVGTDPRTDLAVVKINAKNLPVLKIDDSNKLKTVDKIQEVNREAIQESGEL